MLPYLVPTLAQQRERLAHRLVHSHVPCRDPQRQGSHMGPGVSAGTKLLALAGAAQGWLVRKLQGKVRV